MLFHVSLKGFKFTALQNGKEKLPAVVGLKDLERKVTPQYAEREEVTTIEVEGQKPRREVRRRRERLTRQTIGHPVQRDTLLIEAGSEFEAEAIFKKACGINQTVAKFTISEVKAGPATATPEASPATKRGKPSVDDAVGSLLGPKPPEE